MLQERDSEVQWLKHTITLLYHLLIHTVGKLKYKCPWLWEKHHSVFETKLLWAVRTHGYHSVHTVDKLHILQTFKHS